jgi:hypothetical protein
MFVDNPDPYLLPSYRISPFVTSSIRRNLKINDNYKATGIDYLNQRFGKGNWLLTYNGKEAITFSIMLMQLPESGNITILTPSGNKYISRCVTTTIEQFFPWTRQKNNETIAYFVNHEFGYLFPEMGSLLSEGLPVIEDCCTTFFSQDSQKKVGNYGKYAVYSFPKFFGIQIGGLLVGQNVGHDPILKEKTKLTTEEENYILKVIGFEFSQEKELLVKRRNIFDYATKSFEQLGFTLRFPNQEGVVPSVLLLNNNGIIKDLSAHKEFLYRHGIQNSVFYGEDAFFIPCHQNLEESDIDYFNFVVQNFISNQA